jgi:putative DNA methylase
MVNDPGGERGYYAGKTRAQADAEREELFQIMRDLVKWENTNNEEGAGPRPRCHCQKLARNLRAQPQANPALTPTSCPPSTTPLPVAARCRWKRSAWGWKATPPT